MSGGEEPQGSIGAPTGTKTAAARWQVLRQHVESGVPLTQLAAAEKVGERTLQRWLAAYREGGVAALAPATPPKRGRRTHPDLVAYIEGLALSTPRPSADAVRRQHTIGICHGQAGIGKTLSARRYANWHKAERLLEEWGPRDDSDFPIYAALARKRTVFYTPAVLSTPRQVRDDLTGLTVQVSACIDEHLINIGELQTRPRTLRKYVELIIIDESDRLNATALEMVRDHYDRDNVAVILIGMPGIEKSRLPFRYFFAVRIPLQKERRSDRY